MKEAVDKFCSYGKYLFRDNKSRLRGYKSDYIRGCGDGACNCVNDRKRRGCVCRWVWELKKWPVGQKVTVVLIKQRV